MNFLMIALILIVAVMYVLPGVGLFLLQVIFGWKHMDNAAEKLALLAVSFVNGIVPIWNIVVLANLFKFATARN